MIPICNNRFVVIEKFNEFEEDELFLVHLYFIFEVLKSFKVGKSIVAPAFNQWRGIQYMSPLSSEGLIKRGFIRMIY